MPEAAGVPTGGAAPGRVSGDGLALEVLGLSTHFFTDEGVVRAVDGADLALRRGRTLCVVGESGSGKSVMARSVLQLIDEPGRIVAGEIRFTASSGRVVDVAELAARGPEIRRIRGREIAMVFQEPMSSLSPVHTIGDQIAEAIALHMNLRRREARARSVELLRRVGIPRAEARLDAYPFQLSGGMRQRAMIAMALSCDPELLIADEPTTALDVTTQAGILDLIRDLQRERGMSVMFITHDLGVVAEIADDVAVMYLGTVVERGEVDEVFHDPKHPYTQSLLRSIPKLGLERRRRLESIRGMVPHPFDRPAGCPFHPRCDAFMPGRCDQAVPAVARLGALRDVRCLLHGDDGRPGGPVPGREAP